MVRLTDRLHMTISVDWDVKHFMWVYTVCLAKNKLQGPKYIMILEILTVDL